MPSSPGLGDTPALSPREFQKISSLLYEKAGIFLHAGKQELVMARLGKVLRKGQFRSFDQYHDHVVADPTGASLVALIDALTTNYTYFLREPDHFELLRKTILPALAARARIDIWCAAAATGEEPYSIAMCLLEELGNRNGLEVFSSDISTRALASAKAATYETAKFRSLPREWMQRYVLRGEGKSEGLCRIKPEVTRLVRFERRNLIEPFPESRLYPVIFCRNVMIYFDKPTQERVVNRLAACLEPDGYLLIGHSESLTGIAHPLTYIRPAVYRKGSGGGSVAKRIL